MGPAAAERGAPRPVSQRLDSTAPSQETPLLASFPRPSGSQASWRWPFFQYGRSRNPKEPEPGSAFNDADSLEQSEVPVPAEDAPTEKATLVGPIAMLFVGAWLASVDITMVFAIYNTISSDFGSFQDAMWILAAYHLGLLPAQPVYGKLSDIFGHKGVLTMAYIFFGIGCIVCGLGSSVLPFAVGRVLGGMGGAGMRSLVSSLLVQLVPLRDVAVWRSWMYVMVTFGRSVGAPLGGILADSIGWRGSFLCQAPLALIVLAFVRWQLPSKFEHDAVAKKNSTMETTGHPTLSKLRRIDFLGAFLIAISMVALLLALNFASKKLKLFDPLVIGMILLWISSSCLFLLVEARYASEPIIPLRLLLERDVLTAYLIIGFLMAGSMGMLASVPLYFRVTERASNSVAAAHLLPSIVGNTIGSLLTGWIIKRTGRYRLLTILAPCSSATGYILLYLRWTTKPLALIESFYVGLVGFSTGVSIAAVFVFLTASTKKEDTSIGSGVFYLATSVGEVTGIAIQNSILHGTLGQVLSVRLGKMEDSDEIIRQVTASVSSIWLFPPDIQSVVIDTYVQGLRYTYLFALGCSLVALVFAITVREHSLGPR